MANGKTVAARKEDEHLLLEFIDEYLEYDPSGKGFKFKKQYRQHKSGDYIGSLNKADGYIYAIIKRKRIQLHRLVLLYFNKKLPDYPKELCDHINRDRQDNRIENLRIVTYSENNRNRRKKVNKTSCFLGVFYDKTHNTYVVKHWNDEYSEHIANVSNEEYGARIYDVTIICRNKIEEIIKTPEYFKINYPLTDYWSGGKYTDLFEKIKAKYKNRIYKEKLKPGEYKRKNCTSSYIGVFYNTYHNKYTSGHCDKKYVMYIAQSKDEQTAAQLRDVTTIARIGIDNILKNPIKRQHLLNFPIETYYSNGDYTKLYLDLINKYQHRIFKLKDNR